LVRASFSSVLDSGIWFFGCLGVYRKSILVQIGGFKTDTMSEDMDVALEVYRAGYKAINVPSAVGYTVVPLSFFELLKQRARWWGGGLQAIFKHANMLTSKSSFAIKYLFYNHLWWAAYALISLPLFVYQVYYWWPVVGTTGFGIFAYLFRWFTLSGPVYVVYMNITNQWPWSVYNIFGIMSGLISVVMLVASLIIAKEKSWVKNAVCIFFYFPYTIILNILMIGSIWRFFSKKNKHFIK
jgi:cellulose synthase/poly-beta-1,6-N-acetylglucosamine synthase-like glycosyltransferase